MCRNIKVLYNFEPAVTDEEIQASALQFVKKVSGYSKPSKANQVAFKKAVNEVGAATKKLMDSLVTDAKPLNREVEAAKARQRATARFGISSA